MESYRQRLAVLYDSFSVVQAFRLLRCLKRAKDRSYELLAIEEELTLKIYYELIDRYSDNYIALEEGSVEDVWQLYNLVRSQLPGCHPFFRRDFECLLIDCFLLYDELQDAG